MTFDRHCFFLKLRVRDWEKHPDYFHWYLRDRRLTGSEYKPVVSMIYETPYIMRNITLSIKC